METVFHLVDKTHVNFKMKIDHITKTWRGSPFTSPSWSPGHLQAAEKSIDGYALATGPKDPYLIIDWMHLQSIKPRVTRMLPLLSQTHASELEVDPGHTTSPGLGPEGPDQCSRGGPATRCPPPASLLSVVTFSSLLPFQSRKWGRTELRSCVPSAQGESRPFLEGAAGAQGLPVRDRGPGEGWAS